MTIDNPPVLVEAIFIQRLLDVATMRPDDLAVSDLVTTWTFAELLGRAAAVEKQLGTAREMPAAVVILIDRSASSVAALIGAFWSGNTVVPLDVNEPSDRIIEIARRCGASRIIDATRSRTFSTSTLTVEAAVDGVLESAEWPSPAALPGSARAVVLFTSGSTGQAKGVVRTRENLNEFLLHSDRSGQFYAPIPTACLLPLHFLAGLNAGVLALSTGRFTVLVDPLKPSLDEALGALVQTNVEQLMLPVSLLRAVSAHEPTAGRWSTVRHLITMGEALYGADVRAAAGAFGPGVSVTTLYGSTEGNGFFGRFTVSTSDPLGPDALPVGKPIPPAEVRLDFANVSDEQRAAGIGELMFRCAVASGYLDDPELNAARFGVDGDGARTWRCGDLASLSSDGSIQLRGRLDDVIKINGKLVDPSEPERVLREIPGIRAAVVLPQSYGVGHARLVAHVETDGVVTASAVRAELRSRLPDHLVPALLIRHHSLPVTDRGKPDRAALRAAPPLPWRDTEPEVLHHRLAYPILDIVRRILDLPDLSVDDVLWDVGCDSLAAVEIATEVVEAIGAPISANDLVTARTVRELCHRLEHGGLEGRSFVVPFHRSGRNLPIFVLPGAGSTAMGVHALITELGNEQPVIVLEQRGLHDGKRPDQSLRSMVRRYLREVRRYQPSGPYVMVGRSFGGIVAHEMVRRLTVDGERAVAVLLDTHRSERTRRVRPQRLQQRLDPWPLFVAKLARWRVAVLFRELALLVGNTASLGTVGSMRRYERFGALATEMLRRDRRPVIDSAMWFVYPAGSTEFAAWRDHPRLVLVETGGDHYTMANPPNVAKVVEAIDAAAESVGRSRRKP